MSDSTALIRSLIIFGIVLPLAILLGWMWLEPRIFPRPPAPAKATSLPVAPAASQPAAATGTQNDAKVPAGAVPAAGTAGAGTAAEPALRQVVAALRSRGMVILISDLLLDRALVLKALKFLRHRGQRDDWRR